MSLTRRQQSLYRPLVDRAWRAEAMRMGISSDADGARETWYRNQLAIIGGWRSTVECNSTYDFDLLLSHFATLAGEVDLAMHAAKSAERRVIHAIKRKLAELEEIEQRPVTWNYVRAIYAQMSRHHLLPERLSDCPAELLRRVLAAIDTHIRRLHERTRRAA
ncbi:MAG: hypothetical protein ONB24_15295 [candidate division KSB1 bacterium]|nr:hypothetical protein [candidate division KSB1 bacterium]